MMDIFEQSEFRGLALKGMAQDDPYTSRMELNTETNEDSLNRLKGRQPYIASQFPTNAVYFDEHNHVLNMKTHGNVYKTFSYPAGTSFEACVCFRWDGAADAPTSFDSRRIFCINQGQATSEFAFDAYYSASVWKTKFSVMRTSSLAPLYSNIVSTTSITAGAWYWAHAVVSNSNSATLNIYKDGSAVVEESIANTSLARSAYMMTTFFPNIGGIPSLYYFNFYRGAVAYVGCGPVGSCPAPWTGKVAREGQDDPLDFSFCVQDPSDDSFIAKIATASASALSWAHMPLRGIATSTVNTTTNSLNAIGLSLYGGNQVEVDLPPCGMFEQKTVFMFDIDTTAGYYPIIRSEDSTFLIEGFESTPNYMLQATFNGASATSGQESYCRLASVAHVFAGEGQILHKWLAVEFVPNVSASTNNVAMYQYTAATWTSLLAAASTSYTYGIVPPETNRYIIGGNWGERTVGFGVHDFRISVGDESWKTNHTPLTGRSKIPNGTVTWLNHYKGLYARDDNIKTYVEKRSNPGNKKIIALSDRVDGVLRYKVPQHLLNKKYIGCPYINGVFLPNVDDVNDIGDGCIAAVSDGCYAECSSSSFSVSPRYVSQGQCRPVVSNIGLNKYICGGAPLQYVGSRTRLSGFPRMHCIAQPAGASNSEENSTLDNRGALAYNTVYKYKVTLYNGETGDESNPHGMFRFITDVNPAASTGCGFTVNVSFITTSDIDGLQFRVYRFVSGDGAYHLEGSSKLSGLSATTDLRYFSQGTFTFTMSEADLTIQPTIGLDDNNIPEHLYSSVWNNRSWFIDSYNPSRVFYSKEYQLGNVPTTNFLWSDEGLTGDILGLTPGFGGLLVLKERSIWIIPYFATDEEAVCQQLIPDVGVVGGDASVFVDGILYFASNAGLYIYNGQTTERISSHLNKAELVVWDHDPRSTRAYYDRRNFKVIFWNDGSFVSVDVRSGAIRLGASNDRCVTNISSLAYSGAVYGGTGGVFKEAAGNAGVLGNADDSHSPSLMPELISEFGDWDTTEIVNINTATAALVYNADNWYSINGDRTTVFDLGSATGGQSTLTFVNGAAHTWSSAAAAAPAVVRKLRDDFCGLTSRYGLGTVAVSQSLIAFSSADPTKYVKLQCFESSSTSYNIRIEANDSVSTQAINIATVAVTAGPVIILQLYRVGTTFNAGYKYYDGSWDNSFDGITTITASIGADVYAGICFEDAVGGRAVTVHNLWFYGASPLAYETLPSNRHQYLDVKGSVYGPVLATASGYTSAVNWNWTDGNLGTGTKRVGSKFPLWTRTPTWLVHNSLVGREITHWNDERNDIWSTIIHAIENSGFGVYYYITKQTDLDEFFIGKRPYYYRGQNIYYGKRADAKMFERLEIINGADPGGGNADIIFGSQLHGEASVMTASGTIPCTASTNNILPLRIRGNYGYVEIEGYSPLDVSDVKMLRVHYRPVRPRGRLK